MSIQKPYLLVFIAEEDGDGDGDGDDAELVGGGFVCLQDRM